MAEQNAYTVLRLVGGSSLQTAPDVGVRLDGTQAFSIDAWIRFTALGASSSIVSKEGVFRFATAADELLFEIAGLPPVYSDRERYPLGDELWQHVCATFGGGGVRLFINGQLNVFASLSGSGSNNDKPVLIGDGLQGFLREVRIFNRELPRDAIVKLMHGEPPEGSIAAWFDCSRNPPVDRGPKKLPLTPNGNAVTVTKRPALALSGTAYAQPLRDSAVNPGGQRVDPYTVQASFYLESAEKPQQVLYVNSDLESETGMALLLECGADSCRIKSLRGSSMALTSVRPVPLRRWVNVATTFDGTTLSLYLDGALDSSVAAGPIPLARNHGLSLIGAGLSQGLPSGATSFSGFIGRIDVWSRALTAAEINTYAGAMPDTTAPGIAAVYDVLTMPARNLVTGNPIALAEGAVLQPQITERSVAEDAGELVPEAPEPFAAELDLRALIESNAELFDSALASDRDSIVALGATEDDVARLEEAWRDAVSRLRDDPRSVPLFVTQHRIGDERLLVVRAHGRSYVAMRGPASELDPCTLWKIGLVVIVAGGIIEAVSGVSGKFGARAIAVILKVLQRASVMRRFALPAISGAALLGIGRALYEAGLLRELLLAALEFSIFTVLRVVANILALCIPGLQGAWVVNVVIALAGTAASLIAAIAAKPPECDGLPAVDLAAIRFNHDPASSAVDALSIRFDGQHDVPVPEWTKGMKDAASSPAAYAISQVTGKPITIQARFVAADAATTQAEVYADGGGLLGKSDPVTVDFKGGSSAFVTLRLPAHSVGAGGIRREDITWRWYFRIGGGAWTLIGTTSHRIYALLRIPRAPWVQSASGGDTQLPWTAVLDHACQWAAGATTPEAALRAITLKVNKGIGLRYDTNDGASFYTADSMPKNCNVFLCTEFLAYLNGTGGRGRKVNCTDCATIVTSFANSVGCNIQASVMGQDLIGFLCNKIIAVGETNWAYPFPPFEEFSYHEVAWSGATSFTDPLYDACLEVDRSPDPWNWSGGTHTPELPLGMVFTTRGTTPALPIATPFPDLSYRERLAKNVADGIYKCDPRGTRPDSNGGRRPAE